MKRQLYYGWVAYGVADTIFYNLMRSLGAKIEDKQEITHQLLKPESGLSAVIQIWELKGIRVKYSSIYTLPKYGEELNICGLARIHLDVPDDRITQIGVDKIRQVEEEICKGMRAIIPNMPTKSLEPYFSS